MNYNVLNRQKEKEKAQENAKRADMKQHADKLIQGFDKLNANDSKRALWELFQNAIDLSDQCEVIIEVKENGLWFSHNGKPFTSDTLGSLIKQVSSKGAENNDEQVGQYGTGFITTHSFGKQIYIDGSMEVDDGFFILKDFDIDRRATSSEDLIPKLISQQENIYKIIDDSVLEQNQIKFTTFKYVASDSLEIDYINQALEDIHQILPFVMVLNEKLKTVKIINNDSSITVYSKDNETSIENTLESTININEIPKKVYSLRSEDGKIKIILPLIDSNESLTFNDVVSKLFLYYPLIGTEKFGINFIVHSTDFAATEPRDGIHLKSINPSLSQREDDNRAILEKASNMIFEFIRSNSYVIKNPIHLAQINFSSISETELLTNYFSVLREKWTQEFLQADLINMQGENNILRIKPKDCFFLSTELLDDELLFDDIYSLVKRFWSALPLKQNSKRWSRIVEKWHQSRDIKYITIEMILEKIQESENLITIEKESQLRNFYQYLINSGKEELFSKYKLLPNIKGVFFSRENLNSKLNIPDKLISIANVLAPEITDRHIHQDFKFNLDFKDYNRKNFTSELNSKIALIKDTDKSNSLNKEYVQELIEFCKITSNIDSNSIPIKMVKSICEYYQHNNELVEIKSITDDELDVRTAQRKLVRLFLNDLSAVDNEWIRENISFFHQILQFGNSSEYGEMLQTLKVFPNQLYELTSQNFLKIDSQIPEKLKDIYDEVINPNFPIRFNLVLEGFDVYLKNKENKTARSLAEKIENEFSEDGENINFKNERYKDIIFDIIERIVEDSKWGSYFPLINQRRAHIMLDRISTDEVKSDLFKIIRSSDAKISLLGSLAQRDDLDELISQGEKALLEKKRKDGNFAHIREIGLFIEDMIRKKLSSNLSVKYSSLENELIAKDEQGGQDIIIYSYKKPIYYIEVKSRWDSSSVVSMSKLQLKRASENTTCYSLCAVDMTSYSGAILEYSKVESIEEIKENIKFVSFLGDKIKPLIERNLLAESESTSPVILSDYRGTINQNIIKSGKSFEYFMSDLESFIDKSISDS